MDSDTRKLVGSFRPGYTVEPVPNRFNRWFVIRDNNGEKITHNNGQPIVIGKTDSPQSIKRLRGQLELAGVMESHRRQRLAHERHTPKKADPKFANNPIVMARSILSDSKATPKERSLAKVVLDMSERLTKIQDLAQALGRRVSELEEKRYLT